MAVFLAVVDEGLSYHEAARRFGIDSRTVKMMLNYSPPPGYRRTAPVRWPKLDGFTGVIDALLEADRAESRKQRCIGSSSGCGTSTGSPALLHREGLCAFPGAVGARDFRAAASSAGPCLSRLRRSGGGSAGAAGEKVAFFCMILPHFQRLVRQGVSEGDNGNLSGRPCHGLRRPRRGSALDPL